MQQLTFNAFKKPVNINEQGKEQIDFLYNAALQRSTMYYGSADADKAFRPMRRHYSEDGDMEITRNLITGETSFVFYLSGDAYDAPAIYKEVHSGNSQPVTQNLYYLHRDHLGSIVLITDVDGNAVEKRQFDAWGNIVALSDGNGNPLTTFLITDRGYTGHEHLLSVCLINMNGRLYDPKLHRFLSPDNFVQDPSNTQNFNRYGYVMNNPLIASDPSGEFIHLIAGAIFGGFVNWMVNGFQFNSKGLGYFAVGALAGVLGAGVGSGVSSALAGGSFGSGFVGSSVAKAVGSGFLSGAVVGAAGGGAGGFVGGLGNGLVNGKGLGSSLLLGLKGGGMGVLFGGLSGGIINGIRAVKNSFDFWTGEGTSNHIANYPPINDGGGSVEYSNMSAHGFSETHEELRRLSENVSSLHADGSHPKGYSYDSQTGFIKEPSGGTVYGVTEYKGVFTKSNHVYLSKGAFISRAQLYMTMHHEYMHAYFNVNDFTFPATSKMKSIDVEHTAINGWHRAQLQAWSPYNVNIGSKYFKYLSNNFSNIYKFFGFKVIPYLP